MKTKVINIYSIDELSKEAQERAYTEWLRNFDYVWHNENIATLKAFENIFPVRIRDWSYGELPSGVKWQFTSDSELAELKGPRLLACIWNNYGDYLFKGKYYSICCGQKNAVGVNSKSRRSKIILEASCVLTGYCMDDEILAPMYAFLKGTLSSWRYQTFADIIGYCLDSWQSACTKDLEHGQSFESFLEDSQSNDWTYRINGVFERA